MRKSQALFKCKADGTIRRVLCLMLGLALVGSYFEYASHAGLPVMTDFRAFYCAGRVVREAADPYHFGPLARCEQHLSQSAQPERLRLPVLPVPFPGYAIALFVPLSLLPYTLACVIWVVILCIATCVTVFAFASLTNFPKYVIAIAILPISIGLCVMLGQPTPLVMCALAVASLMLSANKDGFAAVAASISMLEPHIGIGTCAALFVFRRRTRLVLASAAAGMLLTTIATVGVHGCIEYIAAVIPAQAVANATDSSAYSLTSILWLAGVNVVDGVRYGNAMFAIMLITGIAIARNVSLRLGEPALLVLVPPAFAMFGGVHVHLQQLVVEVFPLLILAARLPATRAALMVAIALLMTPWHIFLLPPLMVIAPLFTGAFATSLQRRLDVTLLTTAIPIGVYACAIFLLEQGHGPRASGFNFQNYPASGLVQQEWQDYIRATTSNTDLLTVWLRVPTLLGSAIGIVIVAFVSCGERLHLGRIRLQRVGN